MSDENRWATFALDNLKMAEAALDLKLWNQVCLRAQQAAAESLKAFLAQRHRPIPMVKRLAELLALCAEADPALAGFENACYSLDKFLIPLTYPDAVPTSQAESLPTEKDATDAIATVKDLREALHLH